MDRLLQWHIILSTLCCICFLNSLKNGLVHDDIFAIQTNADIRSDTPIANLLTNDFWGRNLNDDKSHKSYRPLCTLTFRINYLIHGLDPFGYHLTNLLLHIAVVNLFFYILHTVIFQDILPAVMASLIFATHPVHVEAVTGVVGRADVLSCFLFLVAFLNYANHLEKIKSLEYPGNIPLFTKEFCMTLLYGSTCLLVKEHSVTVFGVCVMYDLIKAKPLVLKFLPFTSSIHKQTHSQEKKTQSHALQLIVVAKRVVFLILWVFTLFIIRLQLMGSKLPRFKEEDNPASFSPHLATRVMTYLYLLSFNTQLLLAPAVLCYDWQVGSIPLVEHVTDIRNIYTLTFVCVLTILSIFALARSAQGTDGEMTLVGIAFLTIPFIPASNLFLRVGFVVAERILYIPSLGFSILIAVGMVKMLSFHNKVRYFTYALFALLIIFFSWKTHSYNMVWKSRESLFKSGVVTLPHNAKAHYNYANYLKDNNRTDEAIQHYKNAANLYPPHSSAHNNLGTLLDDDKLAEYHFLEALKYTPGHYRAMFNLAGVYLRQKRNIEAEKMLRTCLGHSPHYYDAQVLFADVLRQNKKSDEAYVLYKTLFSENRDKIDLMHQYAAFLNEIGETQQSLNTFEALLKKNPKDYIASHNMARIYGQHGQYEKAKQFYERAITINPSDTSAYQSLAVLYYNKGDLLASSDVYEKMTKSSQLTREHTRNYAVVLFGLKHHEQAIEMIENMIKDDQYFLQAHYTIINFMVQREDEIKANEVIERALELFPGDVDILLQRGNLRRKLKQYDRAKQDYLEILSSDPNNFHALLNLGTIYHIERDLKNTELYYEMAQRIDPKDDALIANIEKLRRLQARDKP